MAIEFFGQNLQKKLQNRKGTEHRILHIQKVYIPNVAKIYNFRNLDQMNSKKVFPIIEFYIFQLVWVLNFNLNK